MAACTGGDPAADALHHTADSLIAAGRPDSALLLLQSLDSVEAGVGGDLKSPVPARVGAGPVPARERPASLSRRQRMRHELLRARAMNKAYVDFSTDSVMKVVAGYYDRHGTPNERMEAHYLLGCTYRDMGEAPRAIDCYLDAAACADTTATDCNFYMLASIHAQMAWLYHQQLLLSYEIDCHRKASRYNMIAKDTLHAISEMRMVASAYITQNKKDSAETILLKTLNLYQKHGFIQDGLQASLILMNLYAKRQDRNHELKAIIDNYELNSNCFDEHHELHSVRRQFYYYKGVYYESINNLDSAEYYYRKLYFPDMPLTAKNYMYDGLLRVFKKLRQADSIAKYAQLYCEVNDSSIAVKDQGLTAQMTASYSYVRYQKKSQAEAEKAYRANIRFVVTLCVTIVMAVMVAYLVKTYRHRQRQKQKELDELKCTFADTLDMYEQNINELQRLESAHKAVLNLLRQELGCAKSENEAIRQEFTKSRQEISAINASYDEEKARLTEQINVLKKKIDALKQQKGISQYVGQTAMFTNTEIMQHIHAISANPLGKMSGEDIAALAEATSCHYPMLVHDLCQNEDISQRTVCVCMLVAQDFRTDDIARLLGVTGQRVTNIKAELNMILFGEKAARLLRGNLKKKYGIFSF